MLSLQSSIESCKQIILVKLNVKFNVESVNEPVKSQVLLFGSYAAFKTLFKVVRLFEKGYR